MPNKKALTGVVILMMLFAASCGSDYSAEVRKSAQRVLKQDFGSYHFYATPAGNFGIGTMYLKEVKQLDPSKIGDDALIAIPDTYFASTVTADQRKDVLAKLFPEAKIGQFQVNETLAKGVGFDIALPNIQGALQSANANLDFHKGVSVGLNAKQAIVRKLNWTELKRAITDKEIAEDIQDHLTKRDVVIAMDDVVILGYEATVKIDTKTNAALDAEMSKTVGKVVGDASLKLKIEGGQNGTYHIITDDLVVFAVLFREIPSGVLAEQDSDTWPVANVKAENISAMRQVYNKKFQELQK